LIEHGHDANREIARNAAADLEESNGRILRHSAIPLCQCDHVFDAGTNSVHIADRTVDAARGINISQCRILPTRYKHWEILVRRSDHPTVSRIDLVKFL
jgi:hypothetical protein